MKLAKLGVTNFGCVGSQRQEILIDNIVVLIGANDTGKSTLLDAYEAFSATGKEIPRNRYHNENLATPVEIEGFFNDLTEEDIDILNSKWVYSDSDLGECIRVRYIWENGGKGKKQSFNPSSNIWEDGGLGGWDTLLTSRIPIPLRLGPSSSYLEYESVIKQILIDAVKSGLKEDSSQASQLFSELQKLSDQFADEVDSDIQKACDAVSKRISDVFPGYSVSFAAEGGKLDANKLIGAGSFLKISSGSGHEVPIERRGTGVQRSFLWSALSALADLGHVKVAKKPISDSRPKILLIDEPESFLHPPAVRRACDCLYSIANMDNWQVFATTHSPIFLDISRPHTTLVRVESDHRRATKVFQSDKINFDVSESQSLKMIRACHPTINEFFMSDRVFLVEGDTEESVLSVLFARNKERASNYCVVNCRGKANLPLFMKILDHFGLSYVVIHDSDTPKCRRKTGLSVNSAWTVNRSIIKQFEIDSASSSERQLFVHIPNFELHYFGLTRHNDKPNSAILKILQDDFDTDPELDNLRSFAINLMSNTGDNFYTCMDDIESRLKKWVDQNDSQLVGDTELYEFE